MKRISVSVLLFFASLSCFGAITPTDLRYEYQVDSLEERFQSPPDSAKPHTWWHWMNGNVSADGITADLEAMKRVGVGGFQAFDISSIPAGPVKYMSAEWRKLMMHTVREADRLGLEVCLHNCAGWSCSGGPWITPEYSMQQVVWTELQVDGPVLVDEKLKQPETIAEYYRDITVLAFPTPQSEREGKQGFRIDNKRSKTGFGHDNDIKPDTRPVASGDLIDEASIIDLSDKMDAQGALTWKAPKGRWTIVRFGHTSTGKKNQPPPKEGLGLECDKLSKAAAELHWMHSMQKVIDDVGPLAGKVLNNILIDSYEVGQQNWTPGFDQEFKTRMGYEMKTLLPAVTGRVINNLEFTERFLWDYRRVIADMITENYYGHFSEMCHRNGLQLSIEPYGNSGNLDQFAVADMADIPMGEWWALLKEGRWHHSSSKMAASAAHTNGRRFVGAEAFTAGRAGAAFINHPAMLKAQGDYFFCQGINRFIFHTFVHQPWDKKIVPGMTMGPWGFQNNRNNTWYEQGKAWNEYLTRSQYLLQEGTFQADLCYFPGENAPQSYKNREDLSPALPAGYDYDTISRKNLMKMTVVDGRLVLPGLMEYRLLLMPEGPVRAEVLTKVNELLNDGAQVVWAKPDRTPGLQNYPQSDQDLQKNAEKIWGPCDGETVHKNAVGKGHVYWPGSLEPILDAMGVKPDVEFHAVQQAEETLYLGVGYEWIHRKIGTAEVYLISNQQDVSRQVEVVLRSNGRRPELWNAQTGEVEVAPIFGSTDDGRTFVKLSMEPAEAVFVVFRDEVSCASVVDVQYNGASSFKAQSAEFASVSGAVLTAWKAGDYELIYSDGNRKSVSVESVPESVDLSSDWNLHCPKEWGPVTVKLDRLISWTEHSNPELKYFSGTAVYEKQFDAPAGRLSGDHAVQLDLGDVKLFAEVILNGQNLGILWKPPFKLDVSGLLKPKGNQLEIRVTNLWVNRLIGDEQYPFADRYNRNKIPEVRVIHAIPNWVKQGTPRPKTEQKTFATCRFFTKDSPLVESGLIGPVQLHFGVQAK